MEFVNNFVEERITMFWGMKTVHVSWKKLSFLSDEGFPGGLSLSANPQRSYQYLQPWSLLGTIQKPIWWI